MGPINYDDPSPDQDEESPGQDPQDSAGQPAWKKIIGVAMNSLYPGLGNTVSGQPQSNPQQSMQGYGGRGGGLVGTAMRAWQAFGE